MNNSKTSFGRLRANPLANPANNLRLSKDCECLSEPTCQDVIEGSVNGKKVVGFQYEGKTITIPNAVGLWEALCDHIRMYEADPTKVIVSLDGDALTVIHYGAGKLEKILLDDGSSLDATRNCNVVICCEFKTAIAPEAVVTFALDTDTVEVTAPAEVTETNAATIATAINAALKGCKDATVVCDQDAEEFIVSIWALQGTAPTTDDGSGSKNQPADMKNCGCEEIFVA